MLQLFIVMSMIDSEKFSTEDQNEYQSGFGMLLFLVKHSRPDITNARRELSKANNGANPALFHELIQVTRYVLDEKTWLNVQAN